MKPLLRLRSFWCCALVFLLLGGLWVSSRIVPCKLQWGNGTQMLRLSNLAGSFEIDREIHHTSPPAPSSYWTLDSLTPAPKPPGFPLLAWTGWHEKDLTKPTSGVYLSTDADIEHWRPIIGSKQMNVSLPHWLAMLAWLLLGLPLLAWRWRAAKRRSMDVSQVTTQGVHSPSIQK